jgi:predicted metal-dependent phosphoesterase TrpH
MTIDLHMHSTASDGTDDPGALAGLAADAGLRAIALTDHDTTDGHAVCAAACEEAGVEFVPGIEISTDRGRPKGTLHILGYFVDGETPALRAITRELREARNERNPEMVEKLNAIGIGVTMERVVELSGGSVVGRPHIAAAMIELGVVETIGEAFAKYIGRGGAAYVRRDSLSPGLAIEAIHAAGGVAVVAHPIQMACRDDDDLRETLRGLVEIGVDGVEAWHSDHDKVYRRHIQRLAGDFGLLVTGGSDYHGTRKDIALGSQAAPYAILEGLRAAIG